MANCGISGLRSVEPDDVKFMMYSNDEIRKLSVVKITTPQSFDTLGHPTPGGLYDISLGPVRDRNELCSTCSNTQIHCPGHFGHIELPLPVVNPIFFKTIYIMFRMSCLSCHKMQIDDGMKTVLTLQLKLIDAGQLTAALDLESFVTEGMFSLKSSGELAEKQAKLIKKYKKLLKNIDPVMESFTNKNSGVLRHRFINTMYKTINPTKSCKFCKKKLIKVTTSENRLMYQSGKNIKIMMPDEIKKHCSLLWESDSKILVQVLPVLQYTTLDAATDIFFLDVIPVPPPNIRPCNVLQGELIEHPQTLIYKTILQTAFTVQIIVLVLKSKDKAKAIDALDQVPRKAYENATGKEPAEKLHGAWQELQKNVNQLLNCETGQGQGLKQIIEKKTGVIRMHMMGKRVNYAARSVITPDPNVDIDEIGVPDVFAMKLTYPVAVTEWNVDQLRQMVINGPNIHPGAEKIENEYGRFIRIPADCIEKRKSLAKRLRTPDELKSARPKFVHRHLVNGDILLLNRQPSLHKPSMMAHRARILKGEKTFRLHYANCKAYNADFDGDEMNAHFPQNDLARSEAYNILTVRKQYLVPKDGTPLSGLIQDHVISGVKMSIRGAFFTKTDYHQLVFQALGGSKNNIKLLPPAILKPYALWSGKQVLSTVIINLVPKGKPYLSLAGKAKISSKAWQKAAPRQWLAGGTPFSNLNEMSEAEVIISRGELLCGVLDKTHYGATPYGLVHCMYELYGGASASALLSALSKVFTYFLQWEGFTLGVKDILVVDEANDKRDDFICVVRQVGYSAAAQAAEVPVDIETAELRETLEEQCSKNPKFKASLDRQYKSSLDEYTNKINTVCLSEGLLEKFPLNNLQLMVQSGAKGSTVNTMQISCLLGQIELEGKRPPLMISGRSLPSFIPYDVSPRSGGFIDGRFMTGIQPQEFFFHCMAGREGLIDTAVKTSRSGYLQRCLIKHLEGLSIAYDMTVRDADGSIVQFQYGEDGLDVLKCQFLDKEHMKFLDENAETLVDEDSLSKLKNNLNLKEITKSLKTIKKWKKKHGDLIAKNRSGPFLNFCAERKETVEPDNETVNRDAYYKPLEKVWREEDQELYRKPNRPDPIFSTTSPEMKLGIITERLENIMQSYLKTRNENLSKFSNEEFSEVFRSKVLQSMAEPGEPVGLLAAQSIGEPSTQMTLNTFHFAGRGDMNVTLGIPRLREILMTASSNLKTPNMDIPFLPNIEDSNKSAEKLRQKLNKVTVSDVLEKIDVHCEICISPERKLKSVMRFQFLPQSQYKVNYCVKPKQIIKHMQKVYFKEMFAAIKKLAKAQCGVMWATEKDARKKAKRGGEEDGDEDDNDDGDLETSKEKSKRSLVNDGDSSEDDENEDDDDTQAKIRKQHSEEQEYEDPESEEEERSEDEMGKDPDESIKEELELSKKEVETTKLDADATAQILEKFDGAKNYSYDKKNFEWCELTVLFPVSFLRVNLAQALREAATRSVIHEVRNIKRAITVKNMDSLFLKTDGINIEAMFHHDKILDLNKLYSNDIHAIAKTYGIEAACKVIVKEIQNVFNVYGIRVDPRHLSLIADYMTFNGAFEPMSRRGMESSCSPLQQMSFESSLVFLKDAVLNAKHDDITSASSCIMLGQPVKSGTGCFSVYNAIKMNA